MTPRPSVGAGRPARVVVAGATGALGARIVRALLARGTEVTALVRTRGTTATALEREGATLAGTDTQALIAACTGAACVVSALSGMREVIVDEQLRLVDAAVAARCPRFIPSDFCIDHQKLRDGDNRNLDWRRELTERLGDKPIAVTSILNGAFMELLLGPAPFLLFPLRRVLVWGDAQQPLDFTAMDDVAAYTAAAALDDGAPRWLRIAGDVVSASDLARIATEVTGDRWRLLRPGGLRRLSVLVRVLRAVSGGEDELYPAWQGMQYMRDMFSGRARLAPLDNARYPGLAWTRVRQLLAARVENAPTPARAGARDGHRTIGGPASAGLSDRHSASSTSR